MTDSRVNITRAIRSCFHSPIFGPFCIAMLALALSAFFFAPRLWLMDQYNPGTMEWDRAHTYLLQAQNPFRDDIEIVMRWRILPPLVAHLAGLQRWMRSRALQERFTRDFKHAVVADFDMLYAIAAYRSKVSASRFARMFQAIGAPFSRAPRQLCHLFDSELIEDVFVCREFAFDWSGCATTSGRG